MCLCLCGLCMGMLEQCRLDRCLIWRWNAWGWLLAVGRACMCCLGHSSNMRACSRQLGQRGRCDLWTHTGTAGCVGTSQRLSRPTACCAEPCRAFAHGHPRCPVCVCMYVAWRGFFLPAAEQCAPVSVCGCAGLCPRQQQPADGVLCVAPEGCLG